MLKIHHVDMFLEILYPLPPVGMYKNTNIYLFQWTNGNNFLVVCVQEDFFTSHCTLSSQFNFDDLSSWPYIVGVAHYLTLVSKQQNKSEHHCTNHTGRRLSSIRQRAWEPIAISLTECRTNHRTDGGHTLAACAKDFGLGRTAKGPPKSSTGQRCDRSYGAGCLRRRFEVCAGGVQVFARRLDFYFASRSLWIISGCRSTPSQSEFVFRALLIHRALLTLGWYEGSYRSGEEVRQIRDRAEADLVAVWGLRACLELW